MKTLRVFIFLAVALIQLSVPASVVWKRERTLRQGRIWKFRTAPVDPIDVVRGRYVALRFKAEAIIPELERGIPPNSSIYIALKEGDDGFAQVDHLSTSAIKGDNVVMGEAGYSRVRFPFDRFWLTEGNAVAADKAYVENSRLGNENAYVTVRVRDGDAAIEQLFIDNQPLADYLRAHPPK